MNAMTQTSDYGEVLESGAVRFTRLLPGPAERIWAYLTQSELRASWLAAGPMDLRIGGEVELEFWNGKLGAEPETPPADYAKYEGSKLLGHITRLEPPHLLAFTWGEDGSGCKASDAYSEVTFELRPEGEKIRLVLTHRRLGGRDAMLSVSGGWHTHLDTLVERAYGRVPDSFWRRYLPLNQHYDRLLP